MGEPGKQTNRASGRSQESGRPGLEEGLALLCLFFGLEGLQRERDGEW